MSTARYDPRAEYRKRFEKHDVIAAVHSKRDTWTANGRLAVFLTGLALLTAGLGTNSVHVAWSLVPAGLFVALMVVHSGILARKTRAEAAARYYGRCLARIEGRWVGEGIQGADLEPTDHPYAPDLDLFGRGSLFELLCTVRTRAGEETLARWLCEGASSEEIQARQGAVEELRHRLDLREDLALLGGEIRATVRPARLIHWATDSATRFSPLTRGTTWVLAAAGLTGLLGWAFFGFGLTPLLLVISVELVFGRSIKRSVEYVAARISEPEKDLGVLAHVLKRLEDEPFDSALLQSLKGRLAAPGGAASGSIARLHRLLLWLDERRNVVFAPFAFIVMWAPLFAFALERWRVAQGAQVPDWLAAVGECESLCALAAYAYEHPEDPFPELLEGRATFRGRGLGHPLLPEDACVRNDVSLGGQTGAWVVSGSNMSGKSTLLRTVGINAALAFSGAPVRAESLSLSRLVLGATLRIGDSIQSGKSRFYAEITRLRQLMESTKEPVPLLFLLDEILAGTNSHDRRVGANAILRGFLDAGAIGLVTTHDLALTQTAETLGGRVENVHFVDHLEGGQLVFDYRLRPGVVQKSNALALMRAIGLEV